MKSTLKIGAITGTISVIFLFGVFTLVDWLNTKNGWGLKTSNIRGVIGLLSIPIEFIGIFIAIQSAKAAGGVLTYGEALKTGVIVALTVAVMVSVFGLLYNTLLNPGYTAYMLKNAQDDMRASGESPEQIAKDSAQVSASFSTGSQFMQAFIGQFVVGTLISLILSIFLKGKRK